jgi:enoyl-CoA hydratase
MQTHVTFERNDDIGYLTFSCDEPGKPATLDLQTLAELADQLVEIQANLDTLRAVVLQSDSTKYFVVGANVKALQTLDAERIVPWIEQGHTVFDRLERLPLPVLARVEGYVLGGGLELAMACDLIVATDSARFGQPEAKLGFIAGWGGCWRLPRRVGLARAKELFFTGQIIAARRAYEIGLVDFVGDQAGVDRYFETFFESVRECSPVALAQMKKLVDYSPTMSGQDSYLQEAVASTICLSSGDTKARVARFLERRQK